MNFGLASELKTSQHPHSVSVEESQFKLESNYCDVPLTFTAFGEFTG